MDLTIRPRRLRGSDNLRRMVRETRMDTASLIYPMFVMDGEDKVEKISALPGQYRYTVDRMGEELERFPRSRMRSARRHTALKESFRGLYVPPGGIFHACS